MRSRLALIGGKLGHSFSPIIHNYIFKKMGLDATYELMECKEEEIPHILDMVRSGELKAINVTIPYKETVIPYLDEISEEALKIHAVNAITMKDGKLIGYNTDYFGFLNEVKHFGHDLTNRNCFILGCGGAAHAMAQALLDLGCNLTMAIRREDKELAKWFPRVVYLDELDKMDVDVIVNATPVGMYPNCDNMPVSVSVAERCNLVFDAIYNPKITKLMSYAHEAHNGLYMLILQAIKADELFFDMKIDVVNEIVAFVEKEVL